MRRAVLRGCARCASWVLTWRPQHPAPHPPAAQRCVGRSREGCAPAQGWHLRQDQEERRQSMTCQLSGHACSSPQNGMPDCPGTYEKKGMQGRPPQLPPGSMQRLACDCQVSILAVANRTGVRTRRLWAHLHGALAGSKQTALTGGAHCFEGPAAAAGRADSAPSCCACCCCGRSPGLPGRRLSGKRGGCRHLPPRC